MKKNEAIAQALSMLPPLPDGDVVAVMNEEDSHTLQTMDIPHIMAGEAQRAAAVYACAALQEEDGIARAVAHAKRLGCPVLAATGNASYAPLALGRLANAEDADLMSAVLCNPVFTEASLDSRFAQAGFCCAERRDVELEAYDSRMTSVFEAGGTQMNRTICSVLNSMRSGANKQWLIRLYQEGSRIERRPEEPEVFLTVLMRTQGMRIQALREGLLCLTAQSNMDFEVILIGHKVKNECKASIRELLSECPPALSGRLRYIELNEGGRAAPLNKGFELAKGRYMAIFDDDDILTADWVDAFSRAEKRSPGAILHAYSTKQDWAFVEPRGKAGLRAQSTIDNCYCKDFEWIRQVHTNYCPLMSLAFPVYLFRNMHQSFDEALEVMEDWDFLIRMASACGVEDEPAVTSIYRIWKNAENSHVLHNDSYWQKNYDAITRKHRSLGIMLPFGAADMLRKAQNDRMDQKYLLSLIANREESLEQSEEEIIADLRKRDALRAASPLRMIDACLYCDNGSGWSEENTVQLKTNQPMGRFEFSYEHISARQKGRYLRWDPCGKGNVMIRNICGWVTDCYGNKYCFKKGDITSNGIACGNSIVFLHNDPQIYLRLPKGFVPEYLMLGGEARTRLSVEEFSTLHFSRDKLLSAVRNCISRVGRKLKF